MIKVLTFLKLSSFLNTRLFLKEKKYPEGSLHLLQRSFKADQVDEVTCPTFHDTPFPTTKVHLLSLRNPKPQQDCIYRTHDVCVLLRNHLL